MGFSNSKWRKILIILSIINLCFVLFARFSKVFGANASDMTTVTIDNESYDINISYITDNFDYYALIWGKDNNTLTHIDLVCSDSEFYYTNNAISSSSGSLYRFRTTAWNNFASAVSYFNSTTFDYTLGNYTYVNDSNHQIRQYVTTGFTLTTSNMTLANFDVKNTSGDIVFENNTFYAPHFQNISEIEDSTFSDVYISRGDYSYDDYLYFHLLEISYVLNDTNPVTYYYSDTIFALNKDSKYYYTYRGDTENKYSYYAVPRSALGLNPNSSYLYVLTNSQEGFNNSSGILTEDVSNGIYDVIESDTTGVITDSDSINDKIQNIDDTINDNTVSTDTETDIEDSLNFDNQNEGLNNLNNGFFSRLTTMLSNLLGYNLGEDTSVSIPLPNSNKSIVLHSIDIYNNVTGALRLIINAFWVYIFTFYMWKFINKIYIAVSTGNILDTFSSSGEAITNDML